LECRKPAAWKKPARPRAVAQVSSHVARSREISFALDRRLGKPVI
jgi:hypothetical protein